MYVENRLYWVVIIFEFWKETVYIHTLQMICLKNLEKHFQKMSTLAFYGSTLPKTQ